jgi:hypothetical protein
MSTEPTMPACPSCSSTDTARAEAVWRQGTTATTSKTSGMGVGLTGGGLVPVLGSGTSHGATMTELARLCAPRVPTVRLGCAIPISIGLGFVAFWFVASNTSSKSSIVPSLLAWALTSAALIVFAAWRHRAQARFCAEANDGYARRWVCLRCNFLWHREPVGEDQAEASASSASPG